MDDTADAVIGPDFTSMIQEYAASVNTVRIEVHDPAEYGYDMSQLENQVYLENAWGIFAVSENATARLQSALQSSSSGSASSYSASSAITFLYAEARDLSAFSQALIPWVTPFSQSFTSQFASTLIKNISNGQSYSLANIAQSSPQLLAAPVLITNTNIRPLDNPLGIAVIQVGLLYLLIISFFQFNFIHPIGMQFIKDIKMLHFIVARLAMSFFAYFFLSLFYSLISLAFQLDFTKTFGRSGFVVYWMCNFLGMAAVGGASENIATILLAVFPPLIGFWLIFWVVSNVSPTFYSIPLMNDIYRYGYAL